MVDVVDEHIQRLDALLEARVDQPPLVRRDEAGDEVEGEDALRAVLGIRIDREGDALVEEGAVGEIARAAQVARVQLGELRARAGGNAGVA